MPGEYSSVDPELNALKNQVVTEIQRLETQNAVLGEYDAKAANDPEVVELAALLARRHVLQLQQNEIVGRLKGKK